MMSFDVRCEFCGETECLDKCDWPVMGFVVARVRDLQVGDEVRRFNQPQARLKQARVVELQDFDDGLFGARRVVLELIGKAAYPMKVFTAPVHAAIRIKRDTKCERVCCRLHRCERGPGGTYCADHWRLPASEGIALE